MNSMGSNGFRYNIKCDCNLFGYICMLRLHGARALVFARFQFWAPIRAPHFSLAYLCRQLVRCVVFRWVCSRSLLPLALLRFFRAFWGAHTDVEMHAHEFIHLSHIFISSRGMGVGRVIHNEAVSATCYSDSCVRKTDTIMFLNLRDSYNLFMLRLQGAHALVL